MKLCIALFVVACMPLMAMAGVRCGSKGDKVTNFDRKNIKVIMPCKFPAVRDQSCGNYEVSVTPGHVFLYPDYEVNSLWVEIKDSTDKTKTWQGRTDNTLAVKFWNGWKKSLFVEKKETTLNPNLRNSTRGKECILENDDFEIMFRPWDPSNPKFQKSAWSFACKTSNTNFKPGNFSIQTCGGKKSEIQEYGEKNNLTKEEAAIFHSIFTNDQIAQTNKNCSVVTDIMTKSCSEARQQDAMRTCTQILASKPHRMCVTKYSCDPMDIFTACVRWICSEEEDEQACGEVGVAIDLCRDFSQGNLTGRIEAERCYKEFHKMDGEYSEV